MQGEQEDNAVVTDVEMYDSAVADEAPKEEPPTEEPKEGRPRDEKGRFASKEPEAPQEEPPQEEPQTTQEEQPKEERSDHIPSWRLKEEADAKREAIERATKYEAELENLKRQMWQMQAESQQKPQEEPIDIFADPDAYQSQVNQTMEDRFRAMEGNFSLRLAAYRYGDTFNEAWQDMINRTMSGDDSFRQQVMRSPDPGETLVQLYQRERVISEVGRDPTEYKNKVLEDALKDPQFLAKAIEAAKATAGAQPSSTKVELPPSLNKATAAQSPERAQEMTDSSLYNYATGR